MLYSFFLIAAWQTDSWLRTLIICRNRSVGTIPSLTNLSPALLLIKGMNSFLLTFPLNCVPFLDARCLHVSPYPYHPTVAINTLKKFMQNLLDSYLECSLDVCANILLITLIKERQNHSQDDLGSPLPVKNSMRRWRTKASLLASSLQCHNYSVRIYKHSAFNCFKHLFVHLTILI